MTAPADLSKLRINRDARTPPERRALTRNLIIFAVAIVVVFATVAFMRSRSAPVVQVVTAQATSSGASASGGGSTAVTANGYVVARTKASVSAKIAGRLAFLNVSEGSHVNQGDVIARLDNADYEAAVAQAQANIASAEASIIELRADRDQLAREAQRIKDIR